MSFELTRERMGIVKATLHGLWSIDDLDRFTASLDELIGIGAASDGPRTIRMLVYGRDYGVQPKVIVEGMQKYLSARAGALAKTAVIVAQTLHKLQTERVDPSPAQAVFFNEADARDWLLRDAVDG